LGKHFPFIYVGQFAGFRRRCTGDVGTAGRRVRSDCRWNGRKWSNSRH